jgi:dTDP-4-dehydrorhamnose 3,5-epimerase
MKLPTGVQVHPMTTHADSRGEFTEIFREEWRTGLSLVQWNLVRNRKGVLRGPHVHLIHDDYLMVVDGRSRVGLRDLRKGSDTEGLSATLDVGSDELMALVIPAGVLHGFYFPEPSTHVYAVTHYWDPVNDEYGCRWDDPGLGIDWGVSDPILSDKDRSLPPLAELVDLVHEKCVSVHDRYRAQLERHQDVVHRLTDGHG